ncbi:26027_t:CDS:1, partial [Gigaspora rosea]
LGAALTQHWEQLFHSIQSNYSIRSSSHSVPGAVFSKYRGRIIVSGAALAQYQEQLSLRAAFSQYRCAVLTNGSSFFTV